MRELRWELEHYREQKNHQGAEEFRQRFFARMWDLSAYMKVLKQCFTQWFNKRHQREGVLWEGRFKSVLVEDGHAAQTVAAYIDLNPVRAGMVEHPGEYRWSSYGRNAQGAANALIRPHRLYTGLGLNGDKRREAYRELLALSRIVWVTAIFRLAVGEGLTPRSCAS